jgi:hypothetical protein
VLHVINILYIISVLQVAEIEVQQDASPQRVLFLRAEPAVVSLISSSIMVILGLTLNGVHV